MDRFLTFSEEVAQARASGTPIVALETTILSHGMPYPHNVETALAVEAIVREEGCVPATIAVIGGRIHAGLSNEHIEYLGTAKDVLKLSRADLPYAVAAGKDGATTVAATMLCANLSGISVFATGAKALLDLPKTLEVLETRGVPVIGYATAEFPAFWSRGSGLSVPLRFESPQDIAQFLRVKQALRIESGTLIANPIPESDEIPGDEMRGYIETAVEEAQRAHITGKAVTPWLLDRILRLTNGRSLIANVALVKNNARLAARIARALASSS